jgi:hypothetical protein
MKSKSQLAADLHEGINRSRNEQQKSVLLCELARHRCDQDASVARARNVELRKASVKLRQKSAELRKKK